MGDLHKLAPDFAIDSNNDISDPITKQSEEIKMKEASEKRREMFVHKFYQELDSVALSCAEQWYRNRTKLQPPQFDSSFYEQLPFVNNHV